jgi:malate/lactate dehydrogenase
MELDDVSLSLPSIVNRGGIARVLSVPLNSSERKALEASAEVVKRNIATLAQTIPILEFLEHQRRGKTVRKCFLTCRH